MKRALALLLVAAFVAPLCFLGCSGDDGAVGPPGPAGPPGSPQPIRVLIAGVASESDLRNAVAGAVASGAFPLGTEVGYQVLTGDLPSLSTLLEYDAILVYTNINPTADSRVAIGDLLADYVDGGGGVVVTQFALSGVWALGGRIMTTGYSPLWPAASAGTAGNRTIDFDSVEFPLHPVFNSTDARNLVFFANLNNSNPLLDPTATLLALDDRAANAVAINASGTVMALAAYGRYWDEPTRPYEPFLMANACLIVAGAF